MKGAEEIERMEVRFWPFMGDRKKKWGNYLHVWRDGDGSLFARRYDADGIPLEDTFQVNEEGMWVSKYPNFSCALGETSFLVVWKQTVKSSYQLYGKLYDRNGTPLGGSFHIAMQPNAVCTRRMVWMSQEVQVITMHIHRRHRN
jgi:hypothetical protein